MTIDFKIDTRDLDRLIREMPEKADAAVRATALEIQGEAIKRAPVDTGFLRNSIQMVDARKGDFEAEVIVGAEYGRFVEEGTRGDGAQPFLEPAVESARAGLERRLAKLVAASRAQGGGE